MWISVIIVKYRNSSNHEHSVSRLGGVNAAKPKMENKNKELKGAKMSYRAEGLGCLCTFNKYKNMNTAA